MTNIDRAPNAVSDAQDARLDCAGIGYAGVISSIVTNDVAGDGGISSLELERRLLEMGFVEGAEIEVLHLGLFGGDPIAVRLGDARVALRRREAHAIIVSSAAG